MFDDFYIQQISEQYDGREGGEMLLSGNDYQFFLSKNRIQDYVLGFQPLLDITEAKSEPSQPSGAGCTLSKWIHKIWILKTSNCPNEKRLCINFEDHRLWNRPSKSFETRHKALHFKRSWAAWNAVIKTT